MIVYRGKSHDLYVYQASKKKFIIQKGTKLSDAQRSAEEADWSSDAEPDGYVIDEEKGSGGNRLKGWFWNE